MRSAAVEAESRRGDRVGESGHKTEDFFKFGELEELQRERGERVNK